MAGLYSVMLAKTSTAIPGCVTRRDARARRRQQGQGQVAAVPLRLLVSLDIFNAFTLMYVYVLFNPN